MKKITMLCFSILMLVIVAGCSSDDSAEPAQGVADAPAKEIAYEVVLTDAGDDSLQVVQEIRNNTDLDLKSSSAVVNDAPATVVSQLSKEEAENLKGILEGAGATVQINEVEAVAEVADTGVEVYLTDVGDEKIPVINVIRENTEFGLVESKEIADNAPTTVVSGLTQEEAENLKSLLEAAGATVELK